ncbi:MAG: DnaD domain protein [bacterium]|nr:DnaD domain protein [bacterium]MCM1375312.1 DnaD domain protein [Muribaculum sp.]MCM1409771.1 DnaD domain protein [Lachnospiraceae bacterium]
MAGLTIYKDNYIESTAVSNSFIDKYMKDANDAQLKIYLYLLRMIHANLPFSVSDIADKFNHTEKDVLRALIYWEKQKLLTLDYDDDKNLVGIHLCEQSPAGVSAGQGAAAALQPPETDPYAKPSYSADRLRSFKEQDNIAQLLFVAQVYVGRTLTASDMKTILYLSDVLHFSDDLIDYLIQYCVDLGKKDFRYMEKVAVSWAQQGISTPKQAQKAALKYDKSVYAIMNELGKSTSPTSKELEYINRWTREYGFSTDIIFEACERTVLAVDKHRFEYAEGILSSWHRENVQHKADIKRVDEQYQKQKGTPSRSGIVSNKFNQFKQNAYDFEELERELISN